MRLIVYWGSTRIFAAIDISLAFGDEIWYALSMADIENITFWDLIRLAVLVYAALC
jgi:hypothetical protein